MRPIGALRPWNPLRACFALLVLAGCGARGDSSAGDSPLTFERLTGSPLFSNDGPVLDRLDAFRMSDGALRVKAVARLPEGTRTQVAIKSGPDHAALVSVNALVRHGEILSPPMMTETGPLPAGQYQFEISAQFAAGWQSPQVLRATDHGKRLKGPGTLRTRGGGTMVLLAEEMKR